MALSSNVGNLIGDLKTAENQVKAAWVNPFQAQYDELMAKKAFFKSTADSLEAQRAQAKKTFQQQQVLNMSQYNERWAALQNQFKESNQTKAEYTLRQLGYTGELTDLQRSGTITTSFLEANGLTSNQYTSALLSDADYAAVAEQRKQAYGQALSQFSVDMKALEDTAALTLSDAEATYNAGRSAYETEIANYSATETEIMAQYKDAQMAYEKANAPKLPQATATQNISTTYYQPSSGSIYSSSPKVEFGTVSQFIMGEAANIAMGSTAPYATVEGRSTTLNPFTPVGSVSIPGLPGFENVTSVDLEKYKLATKTTTALATSRSLQVRDLLSEAIRQQGKY